MKYDFTSVIDRTGKDSIAWENIPVPNAEIAEGFDRIPMWVAGHEFPDSAVSLRSDYEASGASGVRIF